MNQQIRELQPNDFPFLLREINDPPKQLFALGELPGPDT
jgi:predicted Rossmann fold nucleotide-binding protein DprA/Smf involved in DNA uptake